MNKSARIVISLALICGAMANASCKSYIDVTVVVGKTEATRNVKIISATPAEAGANELVTLRGENFPVRSSAQLSVRVALRDGSVKTATLSIVSNAEANFILPSDATSLMTTISMMSGDFEIARFDVMQTTTDDGTDNSPPTNNSASLTGTSASPERKTFYDSSSSKHWGFWFTGSDVRYGYSSTGNGFTQSGNALAITSPRYTVAAKNGTVLVAYEADFDIKVLRGIISGASISWEPAVAALDGSAASDSFSKPAVTVGVDDRIYVAGFHFVGSGGSYIPKATRSANTYTGALSWTSAAVSGGANAMAGSIALVPQGSYAMAVSAAPDGSVQSFAFNGSVWVQKTGAVVDWFSLAGINGMNGSVYAFAVIGPDLYAGGDFTSAGGVPANGIAKWNGTSWSAVGSGVIGYVQVMLAVGKDLYIGGDFDEAGGLAASNVAKWNGSTWSVLGTAASNGVDNTPFGLAMIGNDLYVGGWFQTAGGVAANSIAKWDGTNWSALGSGPSNGVNNTVYALAASAGVLYVGGNFTSAGGVGNTSNLAKWDGTSWSAFPAQPDWRVGALAVSGSNLFVGGQFENIGTLAAKSIARWDGSSWHAMGSGSPGYVNAIYISGSDVYVAADAWLGKWDGSSWSTLSSAAGQYFQSLGLFQGDLYVGGYMIRTLGGLSVNNIARWRTATSTWDSIGEGFEGYSGWPYYSGGVWDIAVGGSTVYVGGNFTSFGGVNGTKNVAKWDGTSWSALGSGVDGEVAAIAVSGSNVYVGGKFTTASGVAASRIAKWDGTSWSALTTGVTGGFTRVDALAISGTTLYVGGYFTSAGGVANTTNIAKWDGASWSALGTGVNQSVTALAASGTELYVAGNFTAAGGVPNTSYLAKWNGSSWAALGTSGVNGGVSALAVSGSNLFVGGNFTSADGVSNTKRIARWDGTNWHPLGTGIENYAVYSLAAIGTGLYVQGWFSSAGGVTANNLAKWDGSNWSALGSGSLTDGRLVAAGSSLYMAGNGVAVWSTNLVTKASSMSVISDSAGVQLAYVSKTNNMPYYMTFNGTSWNTPSQLTTNEVYGPISVASTPDSGQWLVAWERAGQIEYRKFSGGTWGSTTTVSSGTENKFPTLPEIIYSTIVPIAWTQGFDSPKFTSNPVTLP